MDQLTSAPIEPVRVVLENVPKVGFFRGGPRPPEDDPFPACLRAYLEYRSNDLGFKDKAGQLDPWHDVHVYTMGTSSAAFRLSWDARSWNMGAGDYMAMAKDPLDGIYRAFEAAGYGCEIVLKRDFAQSHGIAQEMDYDQAAFRDAIVHSIRDKGRPVIAFGVIGPPECGLITGYDEGGDVLIGWNFFQDEPWCNAGVEIEPSGYYRKRDWFPETHGLILVGDQTERPAPHQVNRKAVRAGLDLLRTPAAQGMLQAQAAFTRWADTLLKDALFSTDQPALLQQQYQVHHSTAGTLAEARAWGANFLRNMADEEPDAAVELSAAATCFDAEHDLIWAVWEFTRTARSGHLSTEEGGLRFANATTRRRIVPLIRLIRKEDAEAAQHLEKALEIMGEVTAPDLTPGRFGRAVLEDVPKIDYPTHDCPFPGSLNAILQYIGDPVDYDYLMSVTGAAFRRLWNPDDGGNVDLMYFYPEPYKRIGQALNYEMVTVSRDRDKMIQAIRESIARGRPVIEFGIVGPPEAGLITGYDECGDVLIGWSYFQDNPEHQSQLQFEPSGYYRRADWFAQMDRGGPNGLIVLGDKGTWPAPSPREILVSTVKWAIDLARTPRRAGLPDHISGLVAYEMWARELETDADYSNPQGLGMRAMIHCDQWTMLKERHSAAGFLRAMAGIAPEATTFLLAAAELYDRVARESESVWPWPMDWPQVQRGLSDPATRRDIARHIRTARETEAKAVENLEKALDALEHPPTQGT